MINVITTHFCIICHMLIPTMKFDTVRRRCRLKLKYRKRAERISIIQQNLPLEQMFSTYHLFHFHDFKNPPLQDIESGSWCVKNGGRGGDSIKH